MMDCFARMTSRGTRIKNARLREGCRMQTMEEAKPLLFVPLPLVSLSLAFYKTDPGYQRLSRKLYEGVRASEGPSWEYAEPPTVGPSELSGPIGSGVSA